MPYTLPTSADLKAIFPAFAAVADLTVDMWIGRAARSVDASWFEGDYQYSIELLAAHLMVGVGLGTGGDAAANAQGLSGFSMIRSGNLTLQRNSASQKSEVPAEWASTWYGRQFYWLARKNRPAVAVALAPISIVGGYPEW